MYLSGPPLTTAFFYIFTKYFKYIMQFSQKISNIIQFSQDFKYVMQFSLKISNILQFSQKISSMLRNFYKISDILCSFHKRFQTYYVIFTKHFEYAMQSKVIILCFFSNSLT